MENLGFNPEQNESTEFGSLDDLLAELESDGLIVFSKDSILKQLNTAGVATLIRDYLNGIRMSKHGNKREGFYYTVWTTNDLEDPNHPLSQKYRHRKISIE